MKRSVCVATCLMLERQQTNQTTGPEGMRLSDTKRDNHSAGCPIQNSTVVSGLKVNESIAQSISQSSQYHQKAYTFCSVKYGSQVRDSGSTNNNFVYRKVDRRIWEGAVLCWQRDHSGTWHQLHTISDNANGRFRRQVLAQQITRTRAQQAVCVMHAVA
jgi:hypothetical protein